MVLDPVPEVRAAAIHALTTFLGYSDITEQVSQTEQAIASALMMMASDGDSMVRNELLVFFSTFIKRYDNKFLVAAYEELLEEQRKIHEPAVMEVNMNRRSALQFGRSAVDSHQSETRESISRNSVHATIWKHVLILTLDPHADVAQNATIIADYVHAKLLVSPLRNQARSVMDDLIRLGAKAVQSRPPSPTPLPRLTDIPVPTADTSPKKNEGYFSGGFTRTASAILNSLVFHSSGSHENPASQDYPPKTTNAPQNGTQVRTRAPDDWSRPPDANDPLQQIATYDKAKEPLPRGFEEKDDPAMAIDEASGAITDCPIPLKSTFFEWSTEVSANVPMEVAY